MGAWGTYLDDLDDLVDTETHDYVHTKQLLIAPRPSPNDDACVFLPNGMLFNFFLLHNACLSL